MNDSTVMFTASDLPDRNAAQAYFTQQVYTVDLDGLRPQMYMSLTMPSISLASDGRLLYQDKKRRREHLEKA